MSIPLRLKTSMNTAAGAQHPKSTVVPAQSKMTALTGPA
jgi:hypothetical protein